MWCVWLCAVWCLLWCGTLKTSVCAFNTSPCVHSTRHRVYRQHAHMKKRNVKRFARQYRQETTLFCSFSREKRITFQDVRFSKPLTFHNDFMFFCFSQLFKLFETTSPTYFTFRVTTSMLSSLHQRPTQSRNSVFLCLPVPSSLLHLVTMFCNKVLPSGCCSLTVFSHLRADFLRRSITVVILASKLHRFFSRASWATTVTLILDDQLLAFIAERHDRRCDAEKLRVLSNLKTCVFLLICESLAS